VRRRPLASLVIHALGHDNRYVRCHVAAALGRLGDLRAVKPLPAAVCDDSSEVRRSVAGALAQLGHLKWAQWVQGNDGDFQRLGASKDLEALAPLIRALDAESWKCRCAAADALGELGDPQAIGPLKEKALRLTSVSIPLRGRQYGWPVRKAAARALVAIVARNRIALGNDATKLLREPHTDSHDDHKPPSDCHGDHHTDQGIGLEVPAQLDTGPEVKRDF